VLYGADEEYPDIRYADFMRENSKEFLIVTKTFLLKWALFI